MEYMPLISVIVTVYKVEAYLDKCISSIVQQRYTNLEIILVDDGSPDRSGEICDQWAAKDDRIRVIHQKNTGGGAARNAALDIAQGELIAFVDSDDYIAPDMYEHLHSLLASGADIAECGHINVLDDKASFDAGDKATRVYAVLEAMKEHIQDRIFRQLIWNKLYRREIIADIRFPVGTKIDDEFFTYRVLGNARTLVRSEKVCYAYRQQEGSVMHSLETQKRLQAVDAKVQRHEYIQAAFPELAELSLRNLWLTCIYQGQMSLMEMDKCTAIQVLDFLTDVLEKHPHENSRGSMKEKVWLTMAHISFPATCKLRNVLKIGF